MNEEIQETWKVNQEKRKEAAAEAERKREEREMYLMEMDVMLDEMLEARDRERRV